MIGERIKLNKHNGVFVILLILVMISGFYNPGFVQTENLMMILRQASALGILTIGQLFVIVGGGVDLSVAAIMQMGITIFMFGFNNFGMIGLLFGVIAALIFGATAGAVNGVIVTQYHVQPFLTTLFTGSIITGIRMIAAGIKPAGDIPEAIRFLGRDKTFNIPNALIIFILIVIIAYIVLDKSVYGRKLISAGTNCTAAAFSGINTSRIIIQSYVVSGLLSVLAAIVLAGYIGFADQWIGAGYNLNSLVAAVIGGNYLGGGRGSVSGVVGGALTITFVLSFVTLLGFTAPFQHVVSGAVLILALLVGAATSRNQ
jgi:ribose/xylose/arabinose/galactoside ABC-type transport system permease subunit